MSEPILIAAALIDDGAGRLFLVRKRDTSAFMQAGGKIEAGETPSAALARELTEELGFTPSEAEMRYLGRYSAVAANEPDRVVTAEMFHVTRARAGLHALRGAGGGGLGVAGRGDGAKPRSAHPRACASAGAAIAGVTAVEDNVLGSSFGVAVAHPLRAFRRTVRRCARLRWTPAQTGSIVSAPHPWEVRHAAIRDREGHARCRRPRLG